MKCKEPSVFSGPARPSTPVYRAFLTSTLVDPKSLDNLFYKNRRKCDLANPVFSNRIIHFTHPRWQIRCKSSAEDIKSVLSSVRTHPIYAVRQSSFTNSEYEKVEVVTLFLSKQCPINIPSNTARINQELRETENRYLTAPTLSLQRQIRGLNLRKQRAVKRKKIK